MLLDPDVDELINRAEQLVDSRGDVVRRNIGHLHEIVTQTGHRFTILMPPEMTMHELCAEFRIGYDHWCADPIGGIQLRDIHDHIDTYYENPDRSPAWNSHYTVHELFHTELHGAFEHAVMQLWFMGYRYATNHHHVVTRTVSLVHHVRVFIGGQHFGTYYPFGRHDDAAEQGIAVCHHTNPWDADGGSAPCATRFVPNPKFRPKDLDRS